MKNGTFGVPFSLRISGFYFFAAAAFLQDRRI